MKLKLVNIFNAAPQQGYPLFETTANTNKRTKYNTFLNMYGNTKIRKPINFVILLQYSYSIIPGKCKVFTVNSVITRFIVCFFM